MDPRSYTTSPHLYDINQSFVVSPRDIDRSTIHSAQHKKTGLTAKLRQTINTVAGKRNDRSHSTDNITPDLSHLSPQSHELILRTVDAIKHQESTTVIDTLDESRAILQHSLDEFKREQEEYRQQLEQIMREKEATIQRPKENTIPLSILLKQKHDVRGLADLRPNSSMNPTYQAHFEALLVDTHHPQQHASDRAAVVKYIRRRERRKRAEENKKNYQLTNDTLEQKTAELIQNMEGIDIKLEHERQRQNELMRQKMNEKRVKSNTMQQAHEIIGQANEAALQRERVEKMQRDKIEARLSAVRQQQNRSPSNLIQVQSRIDEDGENEESGGGGWAAMNDEERQTTNQSIARLRDESGRDWVGDVDDDGGSSERRERVPVIEI